MATGITYTLLDFVFNCSPSLTFVGSLAFFLKDFAVPG